MSYLVKKHNLRPGNTDFKSGAGLFTCPVWIKIETRSLNGISCVT